jgi:hypothetical protein
VLPLRERLAAGGGLLLTSCCMVFCGVRGCVEAKSEAKLAEIIQLGVL